jgi:ribonuclease HII
MMQSIHRIDCIWNFYKTLLMYFWIYIIPAKASSKVPKLSMSREFECNICCEESAAAATGASFSAVIGCDEAGRGPLCGPVVAAAAWITPGVTIEHGICDSKATTETQREGTFEVLTHHPDVKYAVIRIEHDEIDRINILQASLKAMRLACSSVLEQLQEADAAFVSSACLCLVDGNKVPSDMPVTTKSIIKVIKKYCVHYGDVLLRSYIILKVHYKHHNPTYTYTHTLLQGDSLAFSIAAASILAKVSRDRIMTSYAAEYPSYGLAQHKGYPTLAHRTVLAKLGPSPIHRMSYRPVYESVKGYVKPLAPVKKVRIKKETTKGKQKGVNAENKNKTKIASSGKTKPKKTSTKKRIIDDDDDVSTAGPASTTATMSRGDGADMHTDLSSIATTSSARVTRSSSRKRKEAEAEAGLLLESPSSAPHEGCEAMEGNGGGGRKELRTYNKKSTKKRKV